MIEDSDKVYFKTQADTKVGRFVEGLRVPGATPNDILVGMLTRLAEVGGRLADPKLSDLLIYGALFNQIALHLERYPLKALPPSLQRLLGSDMFTAGKGISKKIASGIPGGLQMKQALARILDMHDRILGKGRESDE